MQERMQIIATCFDKTTDSMIMSIPNLEELYSFKKCVRKYARVKMRCISFAATHLNNQSTLQLTNGLQANMSSEELEKADRQVLRGIQRFQKNL